MLSAKNRLQKSSDVRATLKNGRNHFHPYFVIKYLRTQDEPRLTVVVSTKVYKRANKRNRAKRVIRELLRTHISRFYPGDYVLRVNPKVAKLEEGIWLTELKNFLAKSKLLKP